MKKVLYISYDGLTDPLGQSQVLPYLQHLAKEGYQFTILSFEKEARYKKESEVVRAITDASNIDWVPLFFTAKPPILSKIYDRFRMQRTAFALHKKKGFDMVHCRSYIAAEMGLKLKKAFGLKMLFDMRGFWADEKVDNGQWDLKKPLFKKIYSHYKKKEQEFLLQADGIVSLTEAAKQYLQKQALYRQRPITVIPCCADLAHFDFNRFPSHLSDQKKAELGIPANDKVITYLGSIGGWYLTGEMFRFFVRLQKEQPDYSLLLLTKDDPAKVREEARQAGVPEHKLFISYSTREQLPYYLGFCNTSIFFIRNSFSKIASSPTKHAELMGMGIPVICNDIGDTGHIIEETGTGVLVNEFTDKNFENAVLSFQGLESLDRQAIRMKAKEYFDLRSGAEKYAALYKSILS